MQIKHLHDHDSDMTSRDAAASGDVLLVEFSATRGGHGHRR